MILNGFHHVTCIYLIQMLMVKYGLEIAYKKIGLAKDRNKETCLIQ